VKALVRGAGSGWDAREFGLKDSPVRDERSGRKGEVLPAASGIYASRVRDLEVIDSELRLLLAIRDMVCEAEGRPPSTARIDALLDERAAAARC
jgi:hypothetical protein